MTDPITDYIRANRDRFNRQAITERLVAAGYDRSMVDAAWALVEASEGPSAGATPPPGGTGGFIKGYTVVILLLGGLGDGLLLLVGLSFSQPYGLGANDVPALLFGLLIYGALGFGLYRMVRMLVDASTPGGWAALAAVILVPLAIFGICTASTVPSSLVQ